MPELPEKSEDDTRNNRVEEELEFWQCESSPSGFFLQGSADEKDREKEDHGGERLDALYPWDVCWEGLPAVQQIDHAAEDDEHRPDSESDEIPDRFYSPLPEWTHEVPDTFGAGEDPGDHEGGEGGEDTAEDKEDRIRETAAEHRPEKSERQDDTEEDGEPEDVFPSRDDGLGGFQESGDVYCAECRTECTYDTDEYHICRCIERDDERDAPDDPRTGEGDQEKSDDRVFFDGFFVGIHVIYPLYVH